METVVEVGRPRELKVLRRRTSVTMTAANTMMTSLKVKFSGIRTPVLATSIMPDEKVAPRRTPAQATARITQKGAALEPTAELRKFTASFETPTKRSQTARMPKRTRARRINVSMLERPTRCFTP